jgi:hypothetical protein
MMINKLLISKLHVTRIIQSLPEYTDSQRSLHLREPVEGALIIAVNTCLLIMITDVGPDLPQRHL